MKKKILATCLVVALAATAVIGGTLAYFTDTADQKNTFTVGNVDIKLDETDVNDPTKRTEEDQTFTDAIVPGREFTKDPTITVEEGSQDCYVFLELDMNKYVSLINLIGVDAYKAHVDGLGNDGTAYPGFTRFVTNLIKDKTLRVAVLGRWFQEINHEDWEVMNLAEIHDLVAKVSEGKNADTLKVIMGYKGAKSVNGVVQAGDVMKFMDSFTMPTTVTEQMFDGDEACYVHGVSKSNFNTAKADFKMTFKAHAIQAAEIDNLEAAYNEYFAQNN